MGAALGVTTGITVATCTALTLLMENLVIVAVKLPTVNPLRPVTVSVVAVALVTVPVTPLLNVTLLLAAVLEKPDPSITRLVVLAAKLSVLGLTTVNCRIDLAV